MKELVEILSSCQDCPYRQDHEWDIDTFLCKKLHHKGVKIIEPIGGYDYFPPECPLPDSKVE